MSGGEAFTIAAQVPDSDEGVNVIRFVTTDPDGKPCPWFSGRAITKGAEGVLEVVAGWNDPEGNYRVEATDVASGSHVSGTFEIIR